MRTRKSSESLIEKRISELRHLLTPDETIIVGLSGGIDSMALMEILHRAGVKIVAAHCNFHLRGKESDRDEVFVYRMIQSRWPDHQLEVMHFDTRSYASEQGLSTEMAARELRYEWFEKLRQQYNAAYIAVGHHRNDQVETILLNLVRGTGGQGLVGMSPISGYICRPLLDIDRDDLAAYLTRNDIPHITDSTNSDEGYKRNFIRKTVIPALTQLNPSFVETLSRSAEIFKAEQSLIADYVERFKKSRLLNAEKSLDLRQKETEPHFDLLAYRVLSELNFTNSQIESILNDTTRSGATFRLKGGKARAELFKGQIFIDNLEESSIPAGEVLLTETPTEAHNSDALRVDIGRLDTTLLSIRPALPTDMFRPFGMKNGQKQVFTYLKEKGIPLLHRGKCPVVTHGDTIVALPPWQIDNRYALCDASNDALHIRFIPDESTPLGALIARLIRESRK